MSRTSMRLVMLVALLSFFPGGYLATSGYWNFTGRWAHTSTEELDDQSCVCKPCAPVRMEPWTINVPTRALLNLSDKEVTDLQSIIQPPHKQQRVNASTLFHLLRFYGPDGEFQCGHLKGSKQVLVLLTDDQKATEYFGYPTLIRTRSGVRFPTLPSRFYSEGNARSMENHRDQGLAVLAGLGVSLDQPIYLPDGTYKVSDILADSIANFHFGQEEISWTAEAYALYMPPRRSWCNRYGEEFTFDQLAADLMDRDLQKASCGGTHLLYSLTTMLKVDNKAHVFSRSIRRQIEDKLNQYVNIAVASQYSDGYWTEKWGNTKLDNASTSRTSRRPNSPPMESLLLTSHLAEWLLHTSDVMHVPDSTLMRAGRWLHLQLVNSTEDQRQSDFCPYTHAACVVRSLTGKRFP